MKYGGMKTTCKYRFLICCCQSNGVIYDHIVSVNQFNKNYGLYILIILSYSAYDLVITNIQRLIVIASHIQVATMMKSSDSILIF